MKQLEFIECDQCGNHIQLENVFVQHLEKDFQKKLQSEISKINNAYRAKEDELASKEKDFELKRQRQNEIFQEQLNKEKQLLQQKLQSKLYEEFKQKLTAQEEELQIKSKQLTDLKQKEIEMERLKRDMAEQEKKMELEFERKMITIQRQMEDQISKRVQDQNHFLIAEKDKQLDGLKKQIEEMKRKAEQGSMQLQGEVQELAIEEYLKENFPFDTIEEIKKGARGGDCLQIVNTRSAHNCGSIYYESKRTKDFSQGWIEKFKGDMRQRSADIGVLVTQAMPKEFDRMGLLDGVWVCSFDEFKGLCHVLRENIIKIHQVSKSEENKGEKMEMLYSFLTSNEFKMQIEGIVEGFSQLSEDLQKEKIAMNKIWAKREKQIEKVLLNTTNMYGSIKGIAGNAIRGVKKLELLDEGDEDED